MVILAFAAGHAFFAQRLGPLAPLAWCVLLAAVLYVCRPSLWAAFRLLRPVKQQHSDSVCCPQPYCAFLVIPRTMRIILIYNPMRLFLLAVGDRKGNVTTAELALQQQVSSLYTDHHGWLRGLLRRKLGNAFDAADLAHDVYLHLMKTGRVPPAGESRRHLTRIANGMVIDLYRRRALKLLAVLLPLAAELVAVTVSTMGWPACCEITFAAMVVCRSTRSVVLVVTGSTSVAALLLWLASLVEVGTLAAAEAPMMGRSGTMMVMVFTTALAGPAGRLLMGGKVTRPVAAS